MFAGQVVSDSRPWTVSLCAGYDCSNESSEWAILYFGASPLLFEDVVCGDADELESAPIAGSESRVLDGTILLDDVPAVKDVSYLQAPVLMAKASGTLVVFRSPMEETDESSLPEGASIFLGMWNRKTSC